MDLSNLISNACGPDFFSAVRRDKELLLIE